MKKIALVLVVVILTLSLVSCASGEIKSKNKFTKLRDNEVLVIGTENTSFKNFEDETVTVKELTYILSKTYTLRRSSYDNNSDSVLYNGYYYYWTTSTQTEKMVLGHQTTKNVYTYEYMPIIENESVLVKVTNLTKVSFDYEGGWIEKVATTNTVLNGYFTSFATLVNDCPALADLIDLSPVEKYYVDVTVADTITTTRNTFNSYYYIEEK